MADQLYGFNRDDLESIAESLEKGLVGAVNVGNVTGEGDELLESSAEAAARFIRAALAQQQASVYEQRLRALRAVTDVLRDNYVLALIRALEKRAENGELDTSLADYIERLLGVGKPDPDGEAEYASWTCSVRACPKCGQTDPHDFSCPQ